MVVCTCNPSTGDVETGGSLGFAQHQSTDVENGIVYQPLASYTHAHEDMHTTLTYTHKAFPKENSDPPKPLLPLVAPVLAD